MIRRLFAINFFDAFIAGIMIVAVPLLMLERGIDIAEIGIVFSLAPFAKLAIRTLSAFAADAVGERIFYALASLSNLAQAVAYSLSQNAAAFSVGKAAEGAKESFIWAVNRSSIIATNPKSGHYALGNMVGGRLLYASFGCAAVALLYPAGGFELVFLLAAILSIAMLAESIRTADIVRQARMRLSDLIKFERSKSFWETAAAMAVGGSPYSVVLYVLLPLYFGLAGFSLMQIGLLYAAYFFVFGATMHVISHLGYKSANAAFFGTALFVFCLFGLGFAPVKFAPFLFIIMAVGDAQLALLWEQIIYLEVSSSRKIATDVALLHVPSTLGIAIASWAGGFAVELAGFAPAFAFCALTLAVYAAWALRLSSAKTRPKSHQSL
ncbi:MAG: MFS transporter [Candidatus Micrarchaeota archaeon]|nr:MFS transporter [Candidatus Micrarchaeota archaeon]